MLEVKNTENKNFDGKGLLTTAASVLGSILRQDQDSLTTELLYAFAGKELTDKVKTEISEEAKKVQQIRDLINGLKFDIDVTNLMLNCDMLIIYREEVIMHRIDWSKSFRHRASDLACVYYELATARANEPIDVKCIKWRKFKAPLKSFVERIRFSKKETGYTVRLKNALANKLYYYGFML